MDFRHNLSAGDSIWHPMKRVAFLSVVLAAGCVMEDDPSLSSETQELVSEDPCITWHCGMNSPVVDGIGFHDLHLQGLPNNAGLRITAFTKFGVAYNNVRVANGRISATDAAGNTLVGSALKNAQFWLLASTGQLYLLRISEVDETLKYWAKHGVGLPLIENYILEFALADSSGNPVTGFRNVCRNPPPPLSHTGLPNPDLMGMGQFYAVVYEGDRINAQAKVVGRLVDSNWFNIGCAGHALAKLHLTGHTNVAQQDGLPTTIGERTTILKMLVADYCGNGSVFTVAGQPLHWADDNGWMFNSGGDVLEARWTAQGAACLNQPRIEAHPSAASLAAWPMGIDNSTVCSTPLPPCFVPSISNPFGYHVISANPP